MKPRIRDTSRIAWSSRAAHGAGRSPRKKSSACGVSTKRHSQTSSPDARRLSTEFFGQWLGFYQFDRFKRVDTSRFPEFTQEVQASMYDEAVSFFEYVIRDDYPRPKWRRWTASMP